MSRPVLLVHDRVCPLCEGWGVLTETIVEYVRSRRCKSCDGTGKVPRVYDLASIRAVSRKRRASGGGVMGKALPAGIHRCEVHDRIFREACYDCAHDKIFGDVLASIETTEPQQAADWPNRAKSDWVASHDALVERLSKEATEEIGTPYTVTVERLLCTREIEMTVRCQTCREFATGSIYEARSEERPDWADVLLRNLLDVNGEHGTCDCIDGLTVRECLARYEAWQREDVTPIKSHKRGEVYLTIAQADAAKAAWSSALRTVQSEQREKERVAIMCDDDRWDE